jgi:hypothetical protein
MDKATLIKTIKEAKEMPSKDKLLAWIACLPGTSSVRKPAKNRVGDVYMHPIFQHPYVLLENRKTYWVCGLLTSESKCPEILEPVQSRFFEGYFTKTLFTATELTGPWINVYDNRKHLKSVLTKLRDCLK